MATKPKQMVQCRLERPHPEAGMRVMRVMTCWIEERGAQVGKQVELLPSGEFWTVKAVYNRMQADKLKEAQQQNRTPPPSIRNTAKNKRQQAKT
jgi:hypothetical protein